MSDRPRAQGPEPQTSAKVLMIHPARFGANPETAASNAFQRGSSAAPADVLARARQEFDALVAALRAHDVEVLVVEDTSEPAKPDAVFPNNWLSFHPGGTVVLYPLLAPSRRAEVRVELLSELARRGELVHERVLDLRARAAGAFLEGTGSLVLDRCARIAYACRSPRTDPGLVAEFCRELDFEAVLFDALDARAIPIYHTNVMLSVGSGVAIVCLDALRDARERRALEERLLASGHEIVALDLAQVDEFAGNALELRSRAGAPLLVLSARARRALRPAQLARLSAHATLVSSDLTTIETHGGGSARCMIAEVF